MTDHRNSAESLFVGYAGGNCTLFGVHGYVTGFHKDGKHKVGAFIKCPVQNGNGPILYASLGRTVAGKTDHYEVVSIREIDRDEFDRLTTLDTLRHDLGWR